MATKRSSLGKNLSALLGDAKLELKQFTQDKTLHVIEIPIDNLLPGKYQPRTDISDKALASLTSSIEKQGLLQPLVVRRIESGLFEILAGERRWRACKKAGFTEVPVIIRQVNNENAMAVALIENLQREDLNVLEQANAMQRLHTEFDLTHQQIADILAMSRTHVSNCLRLLHLSEPVKQLLHQKKIEMGHARCLLVLDAQQQAMVGEKIIRNNLSVRETEQLVKQIQSKPAKSPKKLLITSHYNDMVQSLIKSLQTKVQIKKTPQGNGSIVIHYNNSDKLEALLDTLSCLK